MDEAAEGRTLLELFIGKSEVPKSLRNCEVFMSES
jgi:hypothetical protein